MNDTCRAPRRCRLGLQQPRDYLAASATWPGPRPPESESGNGALVVVYFTMIVVVMALSPVPTSIVCVPGASAFRTTTQP